jgi:hypothetical protein
MDVKGELRLTVGCSQAAETLANSFYLWSIERMTLFDCMIPYLFEMKMPVFPLVEHDNIRHDNFIDGTQGMVDDFINSECRPKPSA